MEQLPPLSRDEIKAQGKAILERTFGCSESFLIDMMEQELPNVNPALTLKSPVSILMVDDNIRVISEHLLHLVALTRGKVAAIFCELGKVDIVKQKIIEMPADITLMDEDLGRNGSGKQQFGSELIQQLRADGEQRKFIGFSGDSKSKEKFTAIGANAFTLKLSETKRNIPELIEKINKLFPAQQ